MANDSKQAVDSGVSAGSTPSRARRSGARRWGLTLAFVAVLVLVVIGPWPSDNSTFEGTTYQARTLARLAKTAPARATGGLSVGYAQRDISTPLGHPLAGFNRRDPAAGAVDAPVFARALTLSVGDVMVTVLTADLLMIDEPMRDAVLSRSGLGLGEIYFTASHTHSGPGGWGSHPVEQIITGSFNEAYFKQLAEQLAAVVEESRRQLTPASFAAVTIEMKDGQINRLSPGEPTFDQLAALLFKPADGSPVLVLASYGAHATVVAGRPPTLSPDYPGAMVARLEATTGVRAMFACGAVGDTSPHRPPAPSEVESARVLGQRLADELVPALASAVYRDEVALASLNLRVDLPTLRYPLNAQWSVSPVATSWLADRSTFVHVLRVGDVVLAGFPADYAGCLARPLADQAHQWGLTLVPTSFSGEYKGYLVSRDIYMGRDAYETRDMNFYGPWAGEYVNSMAVRMIQRVSDSSTK